MIEHKTDKEKLYDGELYFKSWSLIPNPSYRTDVSDLWKIGDHAQTKVYKDQKRQFWWTRACSSSSIDCPIQPGELEQPVFPFVRHNIFGPSPWEILWTQKEEKHIHQWELLSQASIAVPTEIDAKKFDIDNFWLRLNFGNQRNTDVTYYTILDVFSKFGGFYLTIVGVFITLYSLFIGKVA